MSAGVIAGAVIGGLVGLGIIIAACCCFCLVLNSKSFGSKGNSVGNKGVNSVPKSNGATGAPGLQSQTPNNIEAELKHAPVAGPLDAAPPPYSLAIEGDVPEAFVYKAP